MTTTTRPRPRTTVAKGAADAKPAADHRAELWRLHDQTANTLAPILKALDWSLNAKRVLSEMDRAIVAGMPGAGTVREFLSVNVYASNSPMSQGGDASPDAILSALSKVAVDMVDQIADAIEANAMRAEA